jgi:hypothetical protein
MKKIFLATLSLAILAFSAEARKVTGKVTCDGKGLSSVVVTDGESFTKTKGNGSFKFEIDDSAEFVYIITPAGYAADWSKGSPEFYKKAENNDNFSFELIKTGDPDGMYNIIAVGDPQPRSNAHFEEFADRPLNDICATVQKLEGQTVGIVLGDICYDVLPLQKRWKEEIVRTKIPFYPSIGNHDHDQAFKNDAQAPHAYKANFGPTNYAFFIGKDIMIVLDNIIYHSRSSYKEGYTEEVLEWVEALMEYIDDDADIYVAQHSPLNGRNHRTLNYNPNIINSDKLIDILTGHKVTFLSGHNHVSGFFQYNEDMMEHNIAAICGTWWDAYHCTDGTPRGYKVFTKKDGKLTWYYKAIDKDPDFQYEVFNVGTTTLNPECLVVNVWDYDPEWKIEWLEDGKPMGKMEQVWEYNPIHSAEIEARYKGKTVSEHKRTGKEKHYFAAKPAEGAKEITIVITNRFGKTWKETIKL